MDRPIKILFLAANPKDTGQLRLDEEMRGIDQALRLAEFRDKFDIKQQWAVRVADLQGYFLRHKPDIVHFSGHGSALNEIILDDNNGNSQPVSGRALSQLFSVLKDNIRCVVLNACYSEQQAQAIAKHIDCVLGMSKAVGDSAAISFAVAFYQALGYGRDVKTAFELGCGQIDLEGLDEKDTPKLLALKNKSEEIVFVHEALNFSDYLQTNTGNIAIKSTSTSELDEIQQDEKQSIKSTAKESRTTLINTVQTPLGFFALVVLLVEVILGITANSSTGNDRTYLIMGMLFLIFLLVLIIVSIAIFRPISLYGISTELKGQINSNIHSKSQNTEIKTEIIENPYILCGCSHQPPTSELEVRTIKKAFPKSKLIIENNLSADKFRELLTQNKFDIVQLTVHVEINGSVAFLDELIPGEGVVQLLEVSNVKLLILACCDSVPLAAKLAAKMNMIAATGSLYDAAFLKWQKVFYQLLSQRTPLSQAYAVARNSVDLPIAMIMKQDVAFAKSR